MAGATAFFTMFALPPIMILLVQVFSLFINPQKIHQELFSGLSDIFGPEAVRLIINVIKAFNKLTYNWVATIAGFLFLTFVATTLFKVIKSSLNQVWALPAQQNRKAITTISSRLQSLVVILSTGLIFSVAVFIETLQVFIGKYFYKVLPGISPWSAFYEYSFFFWKNNITPVTFLQQHHQYLRCLCVGSTAAFIFILFCHDALLRRCFYKNLGHTQRMQH